MKSSITVRKANLGDYDLIFSMHEDWFKDEIDERWGWDEQWQRENFKEEWKRDVFEVILDHGEIIGYSQKTIESDHVYLQSIGLNPEFRGKGIGKEIMEEFVKEAFESFSQIRLSVAVSNHRAIELYQKLEFVIEDRSEHSLTMAKKLTKLVEQNSCSNSYSLRE